MARGTYASPQVTDHGSLVALTADFHAHFVGPMSTILMAAVSSPIGGGGISPGDVVSPAVPAANPPSGTGTTVLLGHGGGGGGGGREILSGGGGSGGANGGGADPGVVASSDPIAGKLPFTGYAATTAAYLGAVFTMTGITLRSKLRRRT
jgi:hypothetical protein